MGNYNYNNLILLTDSYKVSHYRQYPAGTEKIYSYFESRGGEYDSTVFFGLQYFLKNYLQGFAISRTDIAQAKELYTKHLGPNLFYEEGWNHILKDHEGKLPIKIKAVPEGTVVPVHNVLMTIENTCPKCFWLTNYLETLLVQVWYPSTVATISREVKKIILAALEKSGDPAGIDFKLHDFGCRGVSTMESAGVGGCAHLVNFKGTDTVPALAVAKDYYNSEIAGFSIPAAEHSTITSWGEEDEVKAFENMLTQFPTGLVACVSDSWDIDRACKELWGTKLKNKVLTREGTVVVRPDSGDPTVVLPRILNTLGEKLGYTTNAKGYKVLDSHVRVIQGDGITRHSIGGILDAVMDAGWSADNLAFGSGGGLLQTCNRDTQNFAFKCSHAVVNGKGRDVFKRPATASWKNSKKGRLVLTQRDGKFVTEQEKEPKNPFGDYMVTVFENGELKQDYTLDSIRERAKL